MTPQDLAKVLQDMLVEEIDQFNAINAGPGIDPLKKMPWENLDPVSRQLYLNRAAVFLSRFEVSERPEPKFVASVTVRPGPGWKLADRPPLEGPIEPGPYHSDGFQHEVDVTSVGEGRVYFIHRSADRYGESAWRDEESFRMCYQRGRPADAT